MNNAENRLPKYDVPEGEKAPLWMWSEALLIDEALNKGKITLDEAQKGLFEDSEIADMMRRLVDVNFFVEYANDYVAPEKRGETLMELFKKDNLADFLADNNFGVTMAMTRLDENTASVVRYLNDKKVTTTAWIVIEDSEGYWTNKTSIDRTIKKTEAVRKWSKENDLKFKGIGFDLEKPLTYVSAWAQRNLSKIITEEIKYRKNIITGEEASKELGQYLNQLHSDKVETEIYTNPRGFKNLLGGIDVRNVDRYYEMTYASGLPKFLRKQGVSILKSNNALAALGIFCKEGTYPGRDLMNGNLANEQHLTEDELKANIQTVLKYNFEKKELSARNISIFALNDDAYTAKTTDRILRELVKP